jgi:urease accessory protein UreF
MKRKIVAGAVAGLAVAGGGAAIAATQAASPQDESKAVVEDAAKQLGVKPADLSAALKQAFANRIDAAVAAGRLTKQQGEELKQRLRSADYPLLLPGRGFGFGHHGRGPGGGHLDAAAAYLGTTEEALEAKLRSGTTLAQAAKDAGKSVDGLVDALVADEKKELDAAVAAGKITAAQRTQILDGLEARVTARVNGERPARGPGRFGFGGPPRDGDHGGPWS